MSPSERIAALVAELADAVDAGLGRAAEHADRGAIAALPADTARRLVGVAAALYAAALDEGAQAPTRDDLTPTDAVVLATAALRAHDLTPFDLALWFSRSSS